MLLFSHMKMIINFSLDEEIVRELKKEKNRSSLINSYLLNYYKTNLDKVPQEVEVNSKVEAQSPEFQKETEEDLEEVFEDLKKPNGEIEA